MIDEGELALIITAALQFESDTPGIDPIQARVRIGQKIAAGVSAFVIGRTTTVVGTSATGGAVTGSGIINN